MRSFLARLGEKSWIHLVGITLLSAASFAVSLRVIPREKLMPDFISYFAAGTIVNMGGSPYHVGLEAQIQQQLGWDRARDGIGIYDFAPYYYPPWLAMAFALVVPLGYESAREVCYFLNIEMLFLSGYVLGVTAKRVPPAIPLVAVPLFALCLASLLIGQTAILMLFLAALL
jgi:hypothetical protein